MRKLFVLFFALAAAASAQEYKAGDRGPAGGIVFHDKGSYSDGWRWMEAAPMDLAETATWHNGKNTAVETECGIGTGKANTATIVASQGEGRYAAWLCDELTQGGFDDWFLPSKDELNLLLVCLKEKSPEGAGTGWWWSSSHFHFYEAWGQNRADGKTLTRSKGVKLGIRAVRAF